MGGHYLDASLHEKVGTEGSKVLAGRALQNVCRIHEPREVCRGASPSEALRQKLAANRPAGVVSTAPTSASRAQEAPEYKFNVAKPGLFQT